MTTNGPIEHTGTIFDITGNRIDISIEAKDGCAACKLKSACGAPEGGRPVSVFVERPEFFEIGQEVTVTATTAMGMKAVLLSYVVPLLVLLLAVVGIGSTDAGEVFTGLSALAAVGVYYCILYLFRHKIEKEIVFKIKP